MTEQAISALRRRTIEDMTIGRFAQETQHGYVQRVKEFASYDRIRRGAARVAAGAPAWPAATRGS